MRDVVHKLEPLQGASYLGGRRSGSSVGQERPEARGTVDDQVSLSSEATAEKPETGSVTGLLQGLRSWNDPAQAANATGNEADPLQDPSYQKAYQYLEEHGTYISSSGKGGKDEVQRDLTDQERAKLARGLANLPDHILDEIFRTGVNYEVHDSDYLDKTETGALYAPGRDGKPPTIILNDSVFDKKKQGEFGTPQEAIIHESTHLLDDVRRPDASGKEWQSESGRAEFRDIYREYRDRYREVRDRLGLDNFKESPEREQWKDLTREQRQALNGVLFDGGYSATNRDEFLGMGVEAYYGTPQQRERLKETAPRLYDWIERFMSQGSPQAQ